MKRKNILVVVTSVFVVALIAGGLQAQRGKGRGRGKGGPGFRGGRQDPTFQTDRNGFHFLLANRSKVRRKVKNLKNGIETITESDSPQIAAKIQEHVLAMYNRLETKRPIHMRDPLFRELFRHTDKINMKLKKTQKGVHVIETSKDPYVVKLLQKHAQVVSLFIKNGHAEARKNHSLPNRKGIAALKQAAAPAAEAGCCKGKASCCKGKAAEKCDSVSTTKAK